MKKHSMKLYSSASCISPGAIPTCGIQYCLALLICLFSAHGVNCQNANLNPGNGYAAPVDHAFVFHQEGVMQHEEVLLPPLSIWTLHMENLPPSIGFIIFQAHAQFLNLTFSEQIVPNVRNSVNGTNVGSVTKLTNSQTVSNSVYVINPHNATLRTLLVAVAHSNTSPIPGGCNNEFSLENSPFLLLSSSDSLVRIRYQGASWAPMKCDTLSTNLVLQYELFYLDLTQMDHSSQAYFDSLKSFRSVADIRKNLKQVNVLTHGRKVLINAFPGNGMLYVIVVSPKTNLSAGSAYVPALTYSCHPHLNNAIDCRGVWTWFGWLLCGCAFFLGLFMSFQGHRFFQVQLFLMGFCFFGFVCFCLFGRFATMEDSAVTAVCMVVGLIGGVIWLVIWRTIGIPIISILVSGLVLGILLTAVVFSSPLIFLEAFRSDVNFWCFFTCGAIIVPIILLSFGRTLSILSTAVVGMFGMLVAIDRYVGANLTYVVMNVAHRAVIPEFSEAVVIWPLQFPDVGLIFAWFLGSVLGVSTQFFWERNRSPYPPPPGRRKLPSAPPLSSVAAETAPLLNDQLLFPDYQSTRRSGVRRSTRTLPGLEALPESPSNSLMVPE
ncbi:unnamed protein product [Darwinula stevensoni]|uniref:TM7S3/TM198-like domain-containing protein n=1 Tax=Darwinula stevensoni TaxID=69355 RepID=A0A7R9A6K6_9CRUS|nr:unnamed protein product [Darwinula stevensoni]CAG0889496.1 unnamed protein product [Darwinula stevensoni]